MIIRKKKAVHSSEFEQQMSSELHPEKKHCPDKFGQFKNSKNKQNNNETKVVVEHQQQHQQIENVFVDVDNLEEEGEKQQLNHQQHAHGICGEEALEFDDDASDPQVDDEPCSSAAADEQHHQLLPLFNGSRIDVPTFCADFVSIAQTFCLSERACNELLALVKRMAPPDNNVSRCVDGVERARSAGAFKCRHLPMPKGGEEQRNGTTTTITNSHNNNLQKISRANNPRQQNEHNVMDMLHRLSNDVSKLRRECAVSRGVAVAKTEASQIAGEDDDVPAIFINRHNNFDDDDDDGSANDDTFVEDGEEGMMEADNGGDDDGMPMLPRDNGVNAGGSGAIGQNCRLKMRLTKQKMDKCRPKYFVKVLDEHDQVVPICDMSREQMVNTVHISRVNPNTRILYYGDDITGRVLCALDISLHLPNPSYCGRAVADALFSPEFLCRFHLPAEGKTASRSNRDMLPAELLKVFYDTLHKLGASRIIPPHQHGWIEQARDSVNQRNRDIKMPGCRRKFFQNSDPIFK